MSCLARKGGLGQVDDDVAETHWQRKVMSPWPQDPAWPESKILQKYKSLSSQFRKGIIGSYATLGREKQGKTQRDP